MSFVRLGMERSQGVFILFTNVINDKSIIIQLISIITKSVDLFDEYINRTSVLNLICAKQCTGFILRKVSVSGFLLASVLLVEIILDEVKLDSL